MSLQSCEKDETQAKLAAPEDVQPAELSLSKNSVVLNKNVGDEEVLSIQFISADFGFPAAISNTLQFAVKGDNFETVKDVAISAGDNEASFTGYELNSHVLALNIPTEEATEIEVRLKSTVANSIEPVYSTIQTLSVTPYAAISYLYVVGAYNGWSEATGEELISPTSNGIYTASVFFPENELEFKITVERNWENSYGDAGDGKIVLNAGDNITAPQSGMLDLTVNTNTNTIEYTAHVWGIVGDATPGGWDADTDMTYDPETKVWKLTSTLSAGDLKFRKNHSWDVNLGGSNGQLTPGGADIAISTAGTYDIILNTINNTYTLVRK